MAAEFSQLASNLENYKASLYTQAQNEVGKTNSLIGALANANIELSGSKATNSMLDSRDAIIDELNEYAQVTVKISQNNTAEVTLGDVENGPKLLTNNHVQNLTVTAEDDRLNFSVTVGANNIKTNQIKKLYFYSNIFSF